MKMILQWCFICQGNLTCDILLWWFPLYFNGGGRIVVVRHYLQCCCVVWLQRCLLLWMMFVVRVAMVAGKMQLEEDINKEALAGQQQQNNIVMVMCDTHSDRIAAIVMEGLQHQCGDGSMKMGPFFWYSVFRQF